MRNTLPTLHLKPLPKLSKKAIPKALALAIQHIFSGLKKDVLLVGGTALAGYYAEHRRSDDIDLFVSSAQAFSATRRAVDALQKAGAVFSNVLTTPGYYHVDVVFHRHVFTIDVVVDENIFSFGDGFKAEDGVFVAGPQALFAMKAACLVSRCSEKDLFDLEWFFQKKGGISIKEIIEEGSKVDAGLSAETLLISLKGANLREEACGFMLPKSQITKKMTYEKILILRDNLVELLFQYENKMPLSPELDSLRQAIKDLKN